jgi:hypothetical protein
MNWDEGTALNPAAILIFVALLFPVALWFERRDRKAAERERDEAILESNAILVEAKALRDIVLSYEWDAALVENAFRNEARRLDQGLSRLYRDAGLLPPEEAPMRRRVVESDHGVFVRAHDEAEAANILYQTYCQPVRAA